VFPDGNTWELEVLFFVSSSRSTAPVGTGRIMSAANWNSERHMRNSRKVRQNAGAGDLTGVSWSGVGMAAYAMPAKAGGEPARTFATRCSTPML